MKNRKDRGGRDWGLFHHRWGIPVMAALQELSGGAKFVTLQMRLGVSRDSLKRTLAALGRMGLVKRNLGYGHPMRPEYLFTARGKKVAPACVTLMQELECLKVTDLALNKWSLPVVYVLSHCEGRFNTIQDELDTITPRALAQALRDLEDAGLVQRRLVDDRPPRAEYSVTRTGRRLAREVASLLR